MATIEYLPGVCNIGPQEIARRRIVGWVALGVAIIVLVGLIWSGVNPWWRLVIFFPVALSAAGFLQAYFHFCSGFARRGVFNLGVVGQTQVVVDQAAKAKDTKKGDQILLMAAVIGAAVALVCVLG